MQALTIAIGKTGVHFFAQHYLINTLYALFKQLAPPDRTIRIPDFSVSVGSLSRTDYSKISIALSDGRLQNFSPVFQSLVQGQSNDSQPVPVFTLQFNAKQFNAQFRWIEKYHYLDAERGGIDEGDKQSQFSYTPSFGGLAVSVEIQFVYNSTKQTWQITVHRTSATPPANGNANIPSKSILQNQDTSCFSGHVDDATAKMIEAVDFSTPVSKAIAGVLATIPGSGNLGNGIVYDFSLSASDQLKFPDNDGIQIGVKGGASYNNAPFSGPTPPALPLPLPPSDSDTHHLNMYVSNYEVDALNWAFFQAGKLNTVVNAADLPNPNVLKVKTYVVSCPPLKPYVSRAMQAQIQPKSAPVTAFQQVYELSDAVMAVLKNQLSSNVYNNLSGLQGNSYASLASLLADLKANGITDGSDIDKIKAAAQSMGMVVTHDIDYTLIIQNFQPSQPTISFNVQRTDILSSLRLGVGGADNKTQTMKFGFTNVSWKETFISSTVSGLEADVFDGLWENAGESQYATMMQDLGKNGVPLPIMEGFSFDFTNAQLTIQDNYVSILANVLYQSS